MIKSFTITNYRGESVEMELANPYKTGLAVVSVDGLGTVKATINTTKVAGVDGSIYNSSRAESRNIVFNLKFVNNQYGESIEDIRQKTYKFFPLKRAVTILVETDNRKLETKGYVESNEPDIFSDSEGCQISVLCPDSYFYSASEGGVQTTNFYGVEPMFEFPFSNESLKTELIVFGDIGTHSEGNIDYYGDADIGIIMRIHAIGTAENISIYNVDTREVMRIDTEKLASLTGKGIVDLDDIIIDTIKGEKSVTLLREGEYYNILNCLGKSTDWLSLTKGNNILALTADSGITNLQVQVMNQVVYEGV